MQVVERHVVVELLDQLAGALLERRLVGIRPPVGIVALGVELAALVVEAVHDFMADDRANAAVVQRRIGIHVEEGRLQDGGREHDLVLERVVVRVDRLRGHAPLLAIHRLADLGHLVGIFEGRRRHHVGVVAVVGFDRQA